MDKHIQRNIKDTVKNNIKSHPEIDIIYLFGSYCKNTQNRNSDIDIAISTIYKLSNVENAKIISSFTNLLERAIKIKTDIVLLDESSLTLQYEIIKYGYMIYCNNESKRIRLQCEILKKYFDFSYYSDYYNEILIDSIKQGDFLKHNKIKYEVPYYGR